MIPWLIKLGLGGLNLFKTLGALLSRFFRALNSQGWIGLVLCGLLAFLFVRAEGESRHWHKQSDRHEKLYGQEHTGRLADRKSYADAQMAAAQLNQKQIAHVKQQQQEITDATVSHLSARLQLIRGELRGQDSAPQSASGSTAASDPGQAPCRAIDPAWLCLSPEARLSAAESEERHDELIDWAIAQSNVDPNAEPKT